MMIKKSTMPLVLMLVCFAACKNENSKEVNMTNVYESATVHCIGRNSIKIPAAFIQSEKTGGVFKRKDMSDQTSSFDVIVETGVIDRANFASKIQSRSAELNDNYSKNVDVLRLEKKISETAVLFRVQEVEKAYRSELYFLIANNLVVVKLDSYDNTFLKAEEQLVQFMSDFYPAEKDRESIVKGEFCLGPVIVKGKFFEESATFLWRDAIGNTFEMSLDTYRPDDSKSLLKRMSGPESLLSQFNVSHTVLRSRERLVAGMRAQEWLGWANLSENPKEKTFGFALETMRSKGEETAPSLHLAFDSAQPLAGGSRTKTKLSNAEAMTLWDAVVDSIRLE